MYTPSRRAYAYNTYSAALFAVYRAVVAYRRSLLTLHRSLLI